MIRMVCMVGAKAARISVVFSVIAMVTIISQGNFVYAQPGLIHQLSETGIKFVSDACRNDKLISMHIENIRRWQKLYFKIANAVRSGAIDNQSADLLVKEIFERDFDELHESRRKRTLSNNEVEMQRTFFLDLTYDQMYLSAMRVFSLYRSGGDDRRLRRLLEENCLSLLAGK
jgi:hypothetical protein